MQSALNKRFFFGILNFGHSIGFTFLIFLHRLSLFPGNEFRGKRLTVRSLYKKIFIKFLAVSGFIIKIDQMKYYYCRGKLNWNVEEVGLFHISCYVGFDAMIQH
jgi:hypothetical protein